MHHGAGTTTADGSMGQERHDSPYCGKAWKKRRWSVLEIGIVVGSFIVFWPLGIAALILKMTKGELWSGASEMAPPWQNWKKSREDAREAWAGFRSAPQSSGNAAFDEYRKSQLDRLEAERRKLDEERQAFGEHLAKLRRAKDQEEFDRFMAERKAPATE
jgi:Protein of unknown function (DUF2852)